MKGDEGVEIEHEHRNRPLFPYRWIREIDLGDVVIVYMNDGFTLRSFREIVVRTSVCNA